MKIPLIVQQEDMKKFKKNNIKDFIPKSKLIIFVGFGKTKNILNYFPSYVNRITDTNEKINNNHRYNIVHFDSWDEDFYQHVRYRFDCMTVAIGEYADEDLLKGMTMCPKRHFISDTYIKGYGKYYLRYLSEIFNYPMLDNLD